MGSFMISFGITLLLVANIAQYLHSSNLEEEIESLNNTVEQVVQMHNEKNHELNVIKDDMFWLRHVNGELLEKCDPSTVNKVIKKTPLPNMKG